MKKVMRFVDQEIKAKECKFRRFKLRKTRENTRWRRKLRNSEREKLIEKKLIKFRCVFALGFFMKMYKKNREKKVHKILSSSSVDTHSEKRKFCKRIYVSLRNLILQNIRKENNFITFYFIVEEFLC